MESAHAEHGSTTQTSMHGVEDVPTAGVEVWTVKSCAVALAASRVAAASLRMRRCMVSDWSSDSETNIWLESTFVRADVASRVVSVGSEEGRRVAKRISPRCAAPFALTYPCGPPLNAVTRRSPCASSRSSIIPPSHRSNRPPYKIFSAPNPLAQRPQP
jgi:hypothetical protein